LKLITAHVNISWQQDIRQVNTTVPQAGLLQQLSLALSMPSTMQSCMQMCRNAHLQRQAQHHTYNAHPNSRCACILHFCYLIPSPSCMPQLLWDLYQCASIAEGLQGSEHILSIVRIQVVSA